PATGPRRLISPRDQTSFGGAMPPVPSASVSTSEVPEGCPAGASPSPSRQPAMATTRTNNAATDARLSLSVPIPVLRPRSQSVTYREGDPDLPRACAANRDHLPEELVAQEGRDVDVGV